MNYRNIWVGNTKNEMCLNKTNVLWFFHNLSYLIVVLQEILKIRIILKCYWLYTSNFLCSFKEEAVFSMEATELKNLKKIINVFSVGNIELLSSAVVFGKCKWKVTL